MTKISWIFSDRVKFKDYCALFFRVDLCRNSIALGPVTPSLTFKPRTRTLRVHDISSKSTTCFFGLILRTGLKSILLSWINPSARNNTSNARRAGQPSLRCHCWCEGATVQTKLLCRSEEIKTRDGMKRNTNKNVVVAVACPINIYLLILSLRQQQPANKQEVLALVTTTSTQTKY